MPSFIKKSRHRLSRFPAQAVWFGFGTAIIIFLIACLSGTLLYIRAVSALKNEVRNDLIRTATVAAAVVDGDAHQTFTNSRQETTPSYFRAIRPLALIQKASGDIKYIYTCILRQNTVYFILDPTPPGDRNSDGIDDKSHIMQAYPDAAPAMIAALKYSRPEADEEPTRDDWGMLISGYAPICDSHHHAVGVVGVDLAADRYIARLASMRRAAHSGLVLAALLALAAGAVVFIGQRRLLRAERHRHQAVQALQQAHDNLEHRIHLRTADLANANEMLNHAYDATIEGWSRALDLRDHETEGHSRRVTELTLHLARAVGVSDEDLTQIRRGALLHDIGKMGVPDRVLLKPGPLNDTEWTLMCRHPALAYEMLAPTGFLHRALDIPYSHHEKWDGTGYPQGLHGEEIPLAARLFAIVDVWDALRSDRPYRLAWPLERVREHIQNLSGSHFDPALVSVFLSLIDAKQVLPENTIYRQAA